MKIMKHFFFILLLLNTTIVASQEENNQTKNNQDSALFKQAFQTKSNILLQNINHKKFLKRFYRKNHYKTLWLENQKINLKKQNTLFKFITNDLTLNPKSSIFKHYQQLQTNQESNLSTDNYKRELQLTALYYDFLNHLIYGEIQWKSFSAKLTNLRRHRVSARWLRSKPPYSVSKLLNEEDIEASIQKITPKNFGYKNLIIALKKLNVLKEKGGWKAFTLTKKLELSSTGAIVLQLRERLKDSNDYPNDCKENNIIVKDTNLSTEGNQSKEDLPLDPNSIFGSCLEKAVKHFQTRHGLQIDGIVGPGTTKALNLTVESKIKTVLLNIDRIKWLPRDENERYVLVNIPEFMLHYIEKGVVKQQLRVIVGDRKHHTPIFNNEISYIVLNPYWKLPGGIVRREIIPGMIRNPNYLKRHGIDIHTTWNERSPKINPYNIYWEQYQWGERFPYKLMQPPGPKNALGKIKFKFPNRFDVYLHDTPTRYLFKRYSRAFSHGCVRLNKPYKFLDTVASFNANINLPRAKKILKGKRKTHLNMKTKLPIYLVYLTAGMDDNGTLEFRPDIYKYDKLQKRSLR